MILTHEKDQCTDFLSIALKQTKAGPRNSGTPFLLKSTLIVYVFLTIQLTYVSSYLNTPY